MGVFDELFGQETPPWGRIAATFMGGLNGLQEGNPSSSKVLEQLLRWASVLTGNATLRWSKNAMTFSFCSHPGCEAHALVDCAGCEEKFCLAHSMVSHHAEAICEQCAIECVREKRTQRARIRSIRDSEQKIVDALRALRLPRKVTWAEVQAQYKKLAVKHHPDRAKSANGRARCEQRMRDINGAYAFLKERQTELEGRVAA